MAAKLLARLSNEMNVQLTVQDLFRHATITSMAKLIDCKTSGQPVKVDETVSEVDLNKEVDKHDQATLIKWVSQQKVVSLPTSINRAC